MKWAHLPVAGGLYDQHPDLLDKFRLIFERQGVEMERERKKREAEAKRGKSGRLGSSRGR